MVFKAVQLTRIKERVIDELAVGLILREMKCFVCSKAVQKKKKSE